MQRRTFVGGFLAGLAASAYARNAPNLLAPAAPKQRWVTDAQGRQLLPHGFVTLTGDKLGDLYYTLEDYQRMASLGANFQVVRIFLGNIGGWPGYKMDKAYLEQIGEMVTFGKQTGMQSIFKLTIYDISPFGQAQWTQLWTDSATQKLVMEAWRAVFQQFKDEPAVVGYDLVNEPIRGNIKSNEVFVRDHLVPLYRKLIDILHEISPEKWALYQPPLLESRKPGEFPFGHMDVPIERAKIAYSPHYYGPNPGLCIQRYLPEAERSQAALFIGEHGNATPEAADSDLEKQWEYQKVLIKTVTLFDQHALGTIKAWFCGTRFRIGARKATWAVLHGKSDAGGPERKYVMDVLARPVPLVIAGQAHRYNFDFATRIFEMNFLPDASKGESEIYVPVRHHFPDGFRLIYGRGLTLAYDPSAPAGLRVIRNMNNLDASAYRWHPARQRILVRQWDAGSGEATLQIIPGIHD